MQKVQTAQSVLVTGANGQLGNELRILAPKYTNLQFIFVDIEDLDISDEAAVEAFLALHKPDFLVNCAAYTAVDKAEDEPDLAYKINRDAVGYLGKAAARHQIQMVHISTVYVFDGKSYLPYTEDIITSPTGVYGQSKADGEQLLLHVCPNAIIVRTAWLYSSFGNNFLKTMLRLGRERDSLNVVFDQIGTPTYAADLAQGLLQIITSEQLIPGIYHFSNEGVCSWYDFTCAIFKLAGIDTQVQAIESKDYPVKATRPFYSVLNKQKVKTTYNLRIAHWEDGLTRCLKALQEI